jgi:DNA-binding beta-propeller fold protein YncE
VYKPLPLHFGSFSGPRDVTVDQSNGNVYVTDSGANRVEVFGEGGGSPIGVVSPLTGKPLAGSAAPQEFEFGGEPSQVAIDEASGSPSYRDLYVSDAKHGVIDKFKLNTITHEYEYLCQFAGFGELGVDACVGVGGAPSWIEPDGVAVDQSNGNVYGANYEPGIGAVSEFSPGGASLEQLEPNGLIGHPVGVAVAPDRTLYVNDYHSDVVQVTPVPVREVRTVDSQHGSTAVAVDAEGNVFVDDQTYIAEYNKKRELIETFGAGTIENSWGIAVNNNTHEIYVSDRGSGYVRVFGPTTVPDCETGPPSKVKKVTATVSGHVNPVNAGEAEYFFQYGETSAYGQETTVSSVPNGSTSEAFEVNLASLTPETAYHYRLVAKNANGIDEECGDRTFKTLPAVTLGPCKAPPPPLTFSVRLCASISPEGLETSYFFEWGETTGYGGQTVPLFTGTTNSEEEFTVPIEGLEPSTTYHYRVIAENALSPIPTAGSDQTVTTLPVLPTVNDSPPFATGIALREATLHGTINPGQGITSYHFIYGLTTAYGYSSPIAYTPLNRSDDTVEQLITAGLQPGLTVHYALVATNAAGTTVGPDETFTTLDGTLPIVETGGASQISPNTAMISGIVDPVGHFAGYWFEVGTSQSYGTQLFGVISSREEVATALAGLLPKTVYHYRLVASDAAGVVYGADQTFTTPSLPIPFIQPPTLPLLPIPVFPPEKPPPPVRCKKGFVKKGGKCVKKHHKPAPKKHKKK